METTLENYKEFVRLTTETVLSSNSKNEASVETANFDVDSVIITRNVDVIVMKYPDFCKGNDQLLNLMKIVECQELSFVQSCLFGTLKSVYNTLLKKTPETAKQYLSSFSEITEFLITKRKLKTVVTDMATETKKIEDDIEVCMSVFGIITKTGSLTPHEVITCTNNIIKIMDKIWTDKHYIVKIVNVMCPSMIDTPENLTRLKNLTESFYMTPETIQIFLTSIVEWKYPNIKTKSSITDIIKTLFKRSSVLRKWKKDKSPEEIGKRIKNISVLTTGITNYTTVNIEMFMLMFEKFVDVCSKRYDIPAELKNSSDYKKVALSIMKIANAIATEITSENKELLIENILKIWETLEKYLKIGTFNGLTINSETLKPLIEDIFPLKINQDSSSVFDEWTKECVRTGAFDFKIPS